MDAKRASLPCLTGLHAAMAAHKQQLICDNVNQDKQSKLPSNTTHATNCFIVAMVDVAADLTLGYVATREQCTVHRIGYRCQHTRRKPVCCASSATMPELDIQGV